MCSGPWIDAKDGRKRIREWLLSGLVRFAKGAKGRKELSKIKRQERIRKGGALLKR